FERIIFSPTARVTLDIVRNGEPMTIAYELVPNPEMDGIWYPFIEPRQTTTITGVMAGSAAEVAGLMPGDEIRQINGEDATSRAFVIRKTQESEGRPMELTVMRGGELVTVS